MIALHTLRGQGISNRIACVQRHPHGMRYNPSSRLPIQYHDDIVQRPYLSDAWPLMCILETILALDSISSQLLPRSASPPIHSMKPQCHEPPPSRYAQDVNVLTFKRLGGPFTRIDVFHCQKRCSPQSGAAPSAACWLRIWQLFLESINLGSVGGLPQCIYNYKHIETTT